MNQKQYTQALNESKDRNDALKKANEGLFQTILFLEGLLLDYEEIEE